MAEREAVAAFVVPPGRFAAENRYVQLDMRGQLAAQAGEVAEAERVAAELDRAVIGRPGSTLGPDWALAIRATLLRRAGRLEDALSSLEKMRGRLYSDQAWTFALPHLRWARAELLFLLGRHDEAERFYLTDQRDDDGYYIAPRMRRLGQIEEKRGNREKAIAYYTRFVEYWSDCDPELRPQADEARARIAALR